MFFVKYLLEWGGLTKYNNQILKKKKSDLLVSHCHLQ